MTAKKQRYCIHVDNRGTPCGKNTGDNYFYCEEHHETVTNQFNNSSEFVGFSPILQLETPINHWSLNSDSEQNSESMQDLDIIVYEYEQRLFD